MGSPRGDASVTRTLILAAARDLFARRGVDSVSVRQIAAAAGVNHALVHRYFGTKREIVAEILQGEAQALGSMARPEDDTVASLAALGEVFSYVLTEGRTSLLLMLRAEIDGLAPERLLDGLPCGRSTSSHAGSSSRAWHARDRSPGPGDGLGRGPHGPGRGPADAGGWRRPRRGGSGGRAAALRRRARRPRRLYDWDGSGCGSGSGAGRRLTRTGEGAWRAPGQPAGSAVAWPGSRGTPKGLTAAAPVANRTLTRIGQNPAMCRTPRGGRAPTLARGGIRGDVVLRRAAAHEPLPGIVDKGAQEGR